MYHKVITTLGICSALLISSHAYAGVWGVSGELKKHTVELGTEMSYIKYEEPDYMEEVGMMYGIVGSYTYHDTLMAKAEFKSSMGYVDYDGKLANGTPYTINGIQDYMIETRGLIGYDILMSDATYFTPYVGFGYRYLNDDASCDVNAYERESNYFYSPIGAEIITKLENGWSFGGIVEYDLFWYGLQRSHGEDIAEGVNTVNNDQHEGWGVRGSIKVMKEWDNVGIVVEPFVRYWSIGKSDTADITYEGTYIGFAHEPENNSLEIGGKVAVIF
ncbi:MAG: hypothetical protein ABIH71_00160 [Candidatus Omnitrophota bacterium]